MQPRSLVYVVLPKTGLGNLLLVWSRARVFSYLNGIPMVTFGWRGIRLGAWVRNERKKRLYWAYFQETPFGMKLKARFWKQMVPLVREPSIEKITERRRAAMFLFDRLTVHNDLFGDIRDHRPFIREEINQLLKPALRKQLAIVHVPEIAVHIRRGDFKISNPLTPNKFFVDAIRFIRATAGKNLTVTVFTDAAEGEVKEVLELENVRLAEKKADILDILQMSRSRVIVLSRSSTFSYWAAFLSEAIVIKPWEDWQGDIRPATVNKQSFEGKVSFENPASLETLATAIRKETW